MRKSAHFALVLALSTALGFGASAMTNPWAQSDWEFQESGKSLEEMDFWSISDWEAQEKNMGTLYEWSVGKRPGQAAAKPQPKPQNTAKPQPAAKPQAAAPVAPAGSTKWADAKTFQEKVGDVTVQGRILLSSDRNTPVTMQLRARSGPNADNSMRATSQKAMQRACGPQSKSATTLSNSIVSKAGGNIVREISFRCVF